MFKYRSIGGAALKVPRLPETLKHLRVHAWVSVPLAVLPNSLETLDSGEADRAERRFGYHNGPRLRSVQFSTRPVAGSPSLFLMPQLASLTHLNLSIEATHGYSLAPTSPSTSMWPPGLTSIVLSVPSSDVAALVVSLSHLPLAHLSLTCSITSNPSDDELLTTQTVQLLPRALSSLVLTNFGVHAGAWAHLPPSLTKLLNFMHGELRRGPYASFKQTPDPNDFPDHLRDLSLIVTSRKRAISDYFRPNLRRLTLIDLSPRGQVATLPPPAHHLVELKINTSGTLSKNFCRSLPRSLLRLCVDHGHVKLSGVQHLPPKLEFLSTNGALSPVTLLPRNLTHLQFTQLLPSTASKQPRMSPAEIAEHLPRSLTFLFIKRAYGWDESVIPALPRQLTCCRIDRFEDVVRYFNPREELYNIAHAIESTPSTDNSENDKPKTSASYRWWSIYGAWMLLIGLLASFGFISNPPPTRARPKVRQTSSEEEDVYDMFPNVQY